ncbi:serine protease [Scytonema sp. NUACC26]|uniref:S1 family peptidase n=1 Tax=Scytonema sp. NUACC26 TaxID=3140176 RepID=UPI0034DB7F65
MTLVSQSTSDDLLDDKYAANTPSLTYQQNRITVAEIAEQVTVRVLTEPGSGSGVIVERQGQTYTVLTCLHVVANSQDDRYSVLTFDGLTHRARRKSVHSIKNADLALVQFESQKPYRVGILGDSNVLSVGEPVYASGFPNYYFPSKNVVEDTRTWGTRAFRLTKGKVSLLSNRSLSGGYRLGYTNEVEQGMSGGPVLNKRGQIIGINGRLKYPLQGIDVFTFTDGTKPSVKLFQEMEALSWGIPIATFQQEATKISPRQTQL